MDCVCVCIDRMSMRDCGFALDDWDETMHKWRF
jgi:hypothetical protein